jgi:hypothetical protein
MNEKNSERAKDEVRETRKEGRRTKNGSVIIAMVCDADLCAQYKKVQGA